MTRGQNYKERQHFIEGTIMNYLKCKKDFDYIKYACLPRTDSEYIRICDVQGRCVTLEVTARSLEDITEDVARIVLLGKEKITPPANVVTDAEVLRSINPLFK